MVTAIGALFGFIVATYVRSTCFSIVRFELTFSLMQTILSFSILQVLFSSFLLRYILENPIMHNTILVFMFLSKHTFGKRLLKNTQ